MILASKSRVRLSVLEAAGLPVQSVPADIDERGIEMRSGAQDPGQVAVILAVEKAKAVSHKSPERLVLGADQTLALGKERFSKPADIEAARVQLSRLRGRTHHLHSGIALLKNGVTLFEYCSVARLTMRSFSEDFLDVYLTQAEASVTQSVGAYQLEKTGIHLFEKIDGDHFTILGMPLIPLLDFLRRERMIAG